MILVVEDDQILNHFGAFSQTEVEDILKSLMRCRPLKSIALAYRSLSMGTFSLSQHSTFPITKETRCVYVDQKEYATVDPSLVDVVGTDRQSTCVGFVIRNPKSGKICVAHIDTPSVVEIGLTQMLSSLVDEDERGDILDVHLINGYNPKPRQERKTFSGYSFEICVKIVEVLCKSPQRFNIKTLHILNRNTLYDKEGNAYPMFGGFLVETGSGSIFPATFDETTRCPDDFIRNGIRQNAPHLRPENNSLLDTYYTQSDRFCISPVPWDMRAVKIFEEAQNLPDLEFAYRFFTDPLNTHPKFIERKRRLFGYFVKHPDWKETFPSGQPRIFVRTADGGWRRYIKQHQLFKRSVDEGFMKINSFVILKSILIFLALLHGIYNYMY